MHFLSLFLFANWMPFQSSITSKQSKITILEYNKDAKQVIKKTCIALHPQNQFYFDTSMYMEMAHNELTYTTTLNHPNIIHGIHPLITQQIFKMSETNLQLYYQCYQFNMPLYHFNILEYAYSNIKVLIIHNYMRFIERVAFQMLNALYYLTVNRLAHLEVKPSNIVIESYDINHIPSKFILIDLEYIANTDQKIGNRGTVKYMPLEMLEYHENGYQMRDHPILHPSNADIYELGATLGKLILIWIKHNKNGHLEMDGVMLDYLQYFDAKHLQYIGKYLQDYNKYSIFLDFIMKMTKLDFKYRLTSSNALQHPWIQSIKSINHFIFSKQFIFEIIVSKTVSTNVCKSIPMVEIRILGHPNV
eukprot:NODE_158_length_15065_cov_0.349125.p7 type:complete len:361 gc:universal NODE_158_length_15065_cov_0.349125:11393-10311(-)